MVVRSQPLDKAARAARQGNDLAILDMHLVDPPQRLSIERVYLGILKLA